MPKVGELGSGPPLKPYWTSSGGGRVRMYLGHVTDVLARLPERSVHCCVTSPPYWGLRSYLPDGHEQKGFELGAEPSPDCGTKGQAQCGRCFVCNMVAVFRGVRRVLRDDGTLWLNLGDSYGGFGGGKQHGSKQRSNPGSVLRPIGHGQRTSLADGNLVGVPWRVALALQGDGWVLRQDVIWHKPAPMPESVRNRCTKAHEYVFLLTKGPGYFYDPEPLKTKHTTDSQLNGATKEDLIWLAAMIDAEGSICVGRKKSGSSRLVNPTYGARVCCYNTHKAVLDRCVSITGHGTCKERNGSKGRMVYQWQVAGPKTVEIIKAISPYLMIKKQQAAMAVELQAANASSLGVKSAERIKRDIELYTGCSELNKKGYTSTPVTPIPVEHSTGSNKRSVWTVASRGYKGAHFATFPEKLIEPCVLPRCAAPWKRVTSREALKRSRPNDFVKRTGEAGTGNVTPNTVAGVAVTTVGWEPTCKCGGEVVVPCTVLDPFLGSGTSACVAVKHGRYVVGIDLSETYLRENAVPRVIVTMGSLK